MCLVVGRLLEVIGVAPMGVEERTARPKWIISTLITAVRCVRQSFASYRSTEIVRAAQHSVLAKTTSIKNLPSCVPQHTY